jgi:hypothetical protein
MLLLCLTLAMPVAAGDVSYGISKTTIEGHVESARKVEHDGDGETEYFISIQLEDRFHAVDVRCNEMQWKILKRLYMSCHVEITLDYAGWVIEYREAGCG